MPEIQIVVVGYGPSDLLVDCLGTLAGQLPVTVVDNSSSTSTRVVTERHGARYVDAGTNLGFGRAVNLGLRVLADAGHAGADVLLLNPDARINAEGIRQMQRHLRSSQRLACVGATQSDPTSGEQARVSSPFPTPAQAWIEAVGLSRTQRRGDYVIGSVLLMRAEAIADVGGFDEGFFLYAEETDWQKRAHARGWRVAVTNVQCSHIGGGTTTDPVRRNQHRQAGLERYIRKHHGRLGWASFRSAVISGAAARAILLRGKRADAARLRLAILP